VALIVTALAVGMSNLGAAIAVGSAGVDARTKRWILGSLAALGAPLLAAAGVFGTVSVALALLGFEVGRHAARLVRNADALAGCVLIVVGVGVLAHLSGASFPKRPSRPG
jgi:putative Mn2+ efflux pump MntP